MRFVETSLLGAGAVVKHGHFPWDSDECRALSRSRTLAFPDIPNFDLLDPEIKTSAYLVFLFFVEYPPSSIPKSPCRDQRCPMKLSILMLLGLWSTLAVSRFHARTLQTGKDDLSVDLIFQTLTRRLATVSQSDRGERMLERRNNYDAEPIRQTFSRWKRNVIARRTIYRRSGKGEQNDQEQQKEDSGPHGSHSSQHSKGDRARDPTTHNEQALGSKRRPIPETAEELAAFPSLTSKKRPPLTQEVQGEGTSRLDAGASSSKLAKAEEPRPATGPVAVIKHESYPPGFHEAAMANYFRTARELQFMIGTRPPVIQPSSSLGSASSSVRSGQARTSEAHRSVEDSAMSKGRWVAQHQQERSGE